MSTDTAQRVEITRLIRAPRDRVYRAWTDPREVRQWACPTPGGARSYEARVRVGGTFRLRMVGEGTEYTAFGVYREVDPPARLVYTWDWEEEEHRVGETVVTVEFREVPEGTEVRLVHTGFPDADGAEGHREGWTACLDNLVALVE